MTNATAGDGVSAAIACSLSPAAQQSRGSDWSALIDAALSRTPIAGGARITFPAEPGLAARIAALAVQEQQCCPFFSFTIEIADGQLALCVTAPRDAQAMIEQILGTY